MVTQFLASRWRRKREARGAAVLTAGNSLEEKDLKRMLGPQYQFTSGLMLLGWWLRVHSLPISVAPPQENLEPQQNQSELQYKRYLVEVERFLKQDPHFSAKMENFSVEDIIRGKLNQELDHVHIDIRRKLDDMKREELNRLRSILKAKHAIAEEKGHAVDYQAILKQFEHLNYMNPDKFEVEDLDLLMKGINKRLEQVDESQREEFKKYQMMKEHKRRAYIKSLTEEERKKEEKRYQEIQQKRANHPKINHPGSEDQLKQVWEETDGLDPDDFNSKTFFKLHDNNGDGFLDETELEALFNKELEKFYDDTTEDNAIQMEVERMQMRNHVFAEVDTNKDRVISFSEFMESVNSNAFAQNKEWETIDQNPVYTEEELKEFEQKLAKEHSNVGRKVEELQQQRDLKEEEISLQAGEAKEKL
ncbi:nucleobindin-2-like isoform X1 [Takifugu rubripes]|uniref:nucleobindin-2-like isoform X1 n=2 Tax=Takifugu rubripes TaxID=31033 RepID=UPI00114576FF|nr:nucleobindin-2 isoform X1 [Takifugu rubripes]XP_011605347.2 nucleobindin-2 isoform X1 [Takifugu rubripes]